MLTSLKCIRSTTGLTQRGAAEELEIPFPTYRAWEQGVNSPRSVDLVKLAEFFEVSVDALLGRCTSPNLKADYSEQAVQVTAPLYGSIAAGDPIEMNDIVEEVAVPAPIKKRYPEGFFLRVDGSSMDKIIQSGGYAFFDPNKRVENGDIVAVSVDGSDATLKRYTKMGNRVVLLPDSNDQSYQAITLNDESARVMGAMVWMTYPDGYRY
jgi:repressor LexA